MSTNKLVYLFIITAFVYLSTLSFVPYSLQYLVKVLPIIVLFSLAYLTLSGARRLYICAALFASGAGDVFLALPIANSFIFGLSAFLIAQMTYALCFVHFRKPQSATVGIKTAVFVLVVYGLLMAWLILPQTNEMLLPVSIYLAVIMLMGAAALLSNLSSWLSMGAISFIISDSILATSLFIGTFPFSGYLVMLTYYVAQFLLVLGMIQATRKVD